MQVQVRSSSFDVSRETEHQVQELAEEMRRLYPELLGVRLTLEAPPAGPRGTHPRFGVRLELHVPGALIPVQRQHAEGLDQALGFAFAAAQGELEAHRRLRDRLRRGVA